MKEKKIKREKRGEREIHLGRKEGNKENKQIKLWGKRKKISKTERKGHEKGNN